MSEIRVYFSVGDTVYLKFISDTNRKVVKELKEFINGHKHMNSIIEDGCVIVNNETRTVDLDKKYLTGIFDAKCDLQIMRKFIGFDRFIGLTKYNGMTIDLTEIGDENFIAYFKSNG